METTTEGKPLSLEMQVIGALVELLGFDPVITDAELARVQGVSIERVTQGISVFAESDSPHDMAQIEDKIRGSGWG